MTSRLTPNRLTAIILGSTALAGCSLWPTWLGGTPLSRPSASSPRSAGAYSTAPKPPSFSSVFEIEAPTSQGQPQLEVVDLVFDVVRVDVPSDHAHHLRKIWSHVDELRLDPSVNKRLARNGIRIGAASQRAWDPIRAILDIAKAQVRRDRIVPPRGAALLLELGVIRESQAIFQHSRTGTLVGKTFYEGLKLISFDYAFHPELGGYTDLRITLEVQRDHKELIWQLQGDDVRQVPGVDRYVFNDLQAGLRLNLNEIVVVGLNHETAGGHMVGARFLTDQRMGQRFETILFVTPVAIRTPSRPPSNS